MILSMETEHLILRKARKEDLESIWNNVWKWDFLADMMLWTPNPTLEDAEKKMERTIFMQQNNYAYFICLKENDEAIGFVGIKETEEKGVYEDCGLCISHFYQKRGFGKEVLGAIQKLIFEQLDGKVFYYTCMIQNEPSRKLCLSQGFVYSDRQDGIRERDGLHYQNDRYKMTREMYFEGKH